MGRGGDYQGLWVTKVAPPSKARIQDAFLALTRKHLITPWESVKLDKLDRIISIKSSFYGQSQYFLFFWGGAQSYFLQHYFEEKSQSWILHKSWDTQNKTFSKDQILEKDLFPYFDDVGRKNLPDKASPDTNTMKSITQLQMEKYLNIIERQSLDNTLNKKQQRKIINIKKDLNKLSVFNELKTYLEKYPLDIPDVLSFGELKIKFPPESSLEQKRNLAFNKLKNWKKNYALMQERLIKEESTPMQQQNTLAEKIIKPIWKSQSKISSLESKSKKLQKPQMQFENCKFLYWEEFKVHIAIGKTAQANDQLRNTWSKKTDYWFHLEGMPSAHLYLRGEGQIMLSKELFERIGELLLTESGYQMISATLIYCQAKDLKSIKGLPGSVRFKNEKRVAFFNKPL